MLDSSLFDSAADNSSALSILILCASMPAGVMITEPSGIPGSDGGGVRDGDTSVLALDDADCCDRSMAPGLNLRKRASVVVCTRSQRGALLSDRLTLVSPPSLVPGEGGVTLECPMLLGDASRADGKKDIGLLESVVP